MTQQKTLLCLGFGYSAAALTQRLAPRIETGEWRILGTTRNSAKAAEMRRAGVEVLESEKLDAPEVIEAVKAASHIVTSVPPREDGDAVFNALGETLVGAPNLEWFAYLSTIGVYGDSGGAWIDENAPLKAAHGQGARRIDAEHAFGGLMEKGLPLEIFRLAGIYGPGRSAFARLKAGDARIIDKPGQVFNRIHVADIANVLEAAIARPQPGAAYNVSDDEPSAPGDPIRFAAELMGIEPPEAVPFDEAEMSPMAREFYSSSKRCSNAKIKEDLGVELIYPTYREGLRAIYVG